MRVLTDCPVPAASLARIDDWRDTNVGDLDASDAGLWRTLSDQPRLSFAEVPGSSWERLVIIRDAPQSQLDALHAAIGRGLELTGPTAAVALTGRGFRGQRGRTWTTEAGNLFLVVALPIGANATTALPSLIALPAVALADALDARIKWVNDILLDDAKVAGVLTMSHCTGSTLETAVLGMGVNVAHAPEVPATPFVPAVTCTGGDLGAILWRTLDALARRRTEAPAALIEAYRRASCVTGARVRIWDESAEQPSGEPLHVGVVVAIADDLTLQLDDGSRVDKGRLELVP